MLDLNEGQAAPPFDLPTDTGERVSSTTLSGRNVVLYFYPKADTPGCTTEGQDFSALAARFAESNTVVIGVSKDPVKKLAKFKAKYDFDLILASDEEGSVCEAFGTWVEKSMYGRQYMGVERATFLIDGTGTLRRIWRKVSVKGHAVEVLEAVTAR